MKALFKSAFFSMINISARQDRHSRVDFQQGFFQQKKKEDIRILRSFMLRNVFFALLFGVFYFLSLQFIPNYSSADVVPYLSLETASSEVFVLRDTGFVLKPSTQTQIGDRSSSNEVIDYTIEAGDTLFGIAARFGLLVKTLVDNNEGLSQWTALKLGKTIKVLPVDGLLHITTDKDTLASVAKKYSVKEEDITRQNKLEDDVLVANMNLIIPGAKKAVVVQNTWWTSAPQSAPSIYTGAKSAGLVWPAGGKVTQYFHAGHYAIDIADRGKGPIFAAANGVVIKSQGGWNGGYGNMIIIDHGNGLKTLYAHNEKLYVKVGDTVKQGDTIAWMGNTGRVRGVTGIHLHFEVIQNGVKKNPLAYIGQR